MISATYKLHYFLILNCVISKKKLIVLFKKTKTLNTFLEPSKLNLI
jgi:hypothetical protein